MSLNDNNSDFRIFWGFKVLKCFSVNMIISYKKESLSSDVMTGIHNDYPLLVGGRTISALIFHLPCLLSV